MQRTTTITLTALLGLTLSILAVITPVHAAAPAIHGWAWVDQNCDGIRQDSEPIATDKFVLYLYRFGPDGIAFTSDDRQVRVLDQYTSGPNAGIYEDPNDSAQMLPERYRISILQGGRPAGYVPTLYRQGNDPTHWSSLQSNWTTGDPNNGGFQLDPNATVTGGNIGIAPESCTNVWYTNHLYLPFVKR